MLAHALLARVVGAALVAGSLGLTLFSFVPPQLPWNQQFRLNVVSPDFGEMNPQAGVELGGVRVGSVQAISYSGGVARLNLAIDPAYASRLHADASAIIQPHGLLGPKYVALGAGSHGRMADGGTIPESRTVVTTDFDQVLNALQPDVRSNLQVIFVELGTASANNGTNMNEAFASLGEASDNLKATTAQLKASEPDTTAIIVSSEAFNRDIQNAPIAASIADTDRTLADLVKVENDLADSIDHTAGVLESVDVVMNGNSGNLSYVLGKAPGTVDQLNQYLVLNTNLVNSVRPALPNLLTAVVEGESVVSGKDANGHYVRVLALSGACTAGPDPGGSCSSPNAPANSTGPTPGAGSPTIPPGPRGDAYSPLSDSALSALFLGG